MKRGIVAFSFVFILLIGGFASAGFFGDTFGKITGNVVADEELTPLYRLWNADNQDHFYTTSGSGKRIMMILFGYKDEGIEGYVYSEKQSDTVALHRLWNANNKDHFYTTSEAEKSSAMGIGYKDEGIEGYVYSEKKLGTVALHRLWNDNTRDHFYTTDLAGKKVMMILFGYEDEGIEGYIYLELPKDVAEEVVEEVCVDSDSGKSYFEKGTIKLSGGEEFTDSCSTSSGKYLSEMYCLDDGSYSSESYSCPNGCKDGACVDKKCTDSDGWDYYEKGRVVDDVGVFVDECWGELGLKEKYCKDGVKEERYYQCPGGCVSGACVVKDKTSSIEPTITEPTTIKPTITEPTTIKPTTIKPTTIKAVCEDSDGKDYNKKGHTSVSFQYSDGTWEIKKVDDVCINSKSLQEQTCNGDSHVPISHNCPNGCKDGACVEEGETPSIETTINEVVCEESDGGLDYYTKGRVNDSRGLSAIDVCNTKVSFSELIEFKCEEDGRISESYPYRCPNGCKDGACVGNNAASSDCSDYRVLFEGESLGISSSGVDVSFSYLGRGLGAELVSNGVSERFGDNDEVTIAGKNYRIKINAGGDFVILIPLDADTASSDCSNSNLYRVLSKGESLGISSSGVDVSFSYLGRGLGAELVSNGVSEMFGDNDEVTIAGKNYRIHIDAAADFVILIPLDADTAIIGNDTIIGNAIGEIISVDISEGWNLIMGFINPSGQIVGGDIDTKNIKAISALMSDSQDYASIFPTLGWDKFGFFDEAELFSSGFLVYSDKDGDLEYALFGDVVPFDERRIYEGWNFVGIGSYMAKQYPIKLEGLVGNCDVVKSYMFDGSIEEWIKVRPTDGIDDDNIGQVWAIKVEGNCKLGRGGVAGTVPIGLGSLS